MLGRRVGRGGLVRAAATTAVVAGTATAVSGRVANRQANRNQQAADAEAYRQQQEAQYAAPPPPAYAPPPPAYAPQPVAAPPEGDSLTDQLQNLASLYSQGILSQEEFTAAKAKLLG
jgi:Short C-terminal domain